MIPIQAAFGWKRKAWTGLLLHNHKDDIPVIIIIDDDVGNTSGCRSCSKNARMELMRTIVVDTTTWVPIDDDVAVVVSVAIPLVVVAVVVLDILPQPPRIFC
jgi:hypothetical protein